MNEIVVLLGAQIDQQALYEKQPTARRAAQLEASIREAYGQLASFPYSSGSFEGVFRRYILKGFSHGLFYAVEGRRVMIHAVLDLRLPREIIRQRLGLPRS